MTDSDSKAIKAALKQMSTAYAEHDLKLMNAILAEDVFLFGPGVDEAAKGRKRVLAMAERDWQQAERTEVDFRRTHIHVRGTLGYVDTECTFNVLTDGQSMNFPARATFVFSKERGVWRMCQGHFSYPAVNQPAGRSFPTLAATA